MLPTVLVGCCRLFTVTGLPGQVVLGKFFATLIFYSFLWLPSLANFLIFEWVAGESAAFYPGAFYGSYLILFLMGAFYIALGCLSSALTSNQIVAALRSTSSGAVEPAATAPGMLWLDTSTTPPTLKLRNLADAAFEPLLDGGEY